MFLFHKAKNILLCFVCIYSINFIMTLIINTKGSTIVLFQETVVRMKLKNEKHDYEWKKTSAGVWKAKQHKMKSVHFLFINVSS